MIAALLQAPTPAARRAAHRRALAFVAVLAAGSAWAAPAASPPGGKVPRSSVFAETGHGSRTSGVFRDPRHARGSCLQCHGGASPQAKGRGQRFPLALFAAPDRGLCFECHRQPSRSFPGAQRFQESSHASSQPSPDRIRTTRRSRAIDEVGGCSSCHDPHGRRDGLGTIPKLLVTRGDALCLSCHGSGGPGQDVTAAITKAYAHPSPSRPVTASSVAGRSGAAEPAGCVDCHNPHLVRRDPSAPIAPAASARIVGVRRVRVANVASGTPLLEPLPAEDASVAREYEVCLRCHSGASSARTSSPGVSAPLPAIAQRGVDIAALVNPNNASFHPVEAPGKNLAIRSDGFAARWSADRLVYCSDCHSSDDGALRGPHGSSNEHLLKKRYPPASRVEGLQDSDLCFDCHSFATYALPGAGSAALATRFDRHAAHSLKGYGCAACHDPHGSVALPALLVVRNLGLATIETTPMGGTCTTTCHVTTPRLVTYRLNYPR